jgi:hypothetical protein
MTGNAMTRSRGIGLGNGLFLSNFSVEDGRHDKRLRFYL